MVSPGISHPYGAVPLLGPFLHHDTPTCSNDLKKMGGYQTSEAPFCVYAVYISSGIDCSIVIEHGPVELDRIVDLPS